MIGLYITAFITGLFGSLHCAGMCGPLAISFNMHNGGQAAGQSFLYNIARIFAYVLLGIIFGAIGLSFSFAGLQQAASFTMGALIIILVAMQWISNRSVWNWHWLTKGTGLVKKYIATAFSSRQPGSVLTLGFFNGLLPCGLVYLALAGAVASGSMAGGAAYMLFFGLGTLPLMFSFAAFGSYLGLQQRRFIRKYLPVFSMVIAVLLILRGLDLGIPYLSPHFEAGHAGHAPAAHEICVPPTR